MPKRRSAAAGSASATKSTTKRKSPVTPPRADEALAAEGRNVQAALKKYFAPMRKRKPKLCAASLLNDFTAKLRATTTAITAHAHGIDAERAAKLAKDALLVALLVEIKSILADITAKYGDTDPTTCRAFGRAKSLKTAQEAVAVASEQQQAFEGATFGALARDAGIDKKRIDRLIAARRAVAEGLTAKKSAGTDKVGQQIEKRALVKDLRASIRHVRRIANAAFPGEAPVLKAFGIAPPGRKKGSREKKKAPAASSAAPPAAPAH